MNFTELTEKEFDSVCENFKGSSFYQTTDWAKIKEFTNWIHYYVGVKKDNQIVACTLILGKNLYLNQFLYYAPRGMLLDYDDNKLLTFFVTNLKKYLKEKNGVIFKIDPLVEYQHHDKYGNILNDNFTNQPIIDNLKKLGFKHHGFTKGYTDEAQFRWSYCLDIKEKEALLKDMDQRCRRCIRKAEKYPLELVDVDDNNIKDFKNIMEHTANRQKHFDRKLEYYKNLDLKLKEKSKLVIIYLDRNKFIENFKEDKLYEKILNDKREKIPISAGVFIFDKERANYVYGGTYQEYMSLMAPYKMQIEMIEYTKELGISLYDFGGISGSFKPKSKNYGVYEFKRGFGGYVIEYIGEFDLILKYIGYNVYDKGYDVYREIRHLAAKIIKLTK